MDLSEQMKLDLLDMANDLEVIAAKLKVIEGQARDEAWYAVTEATEGAGIHIRQAFERLQNEVRHSFNFALGPRS